MSLNRLLRGFKRLQQSPQKLTKRRTKRETSLHRTWLKFKKISSPPGLLLISLLVLSFSNEQSIKFSLLFTYSRKWRFIFVRNDLASAKKTHETYEEMCSSYERRLDNNKQEFLLLQARTNKSCKNGECNQSQFWKKKKKNPCSWTVWLVYQVKKDKAESAEATQAAKIHDLAMKVLEEQGTLKQLHGEKTAMMSQLDEQVGQGKKTQMLWWNFELLVSVPRAKILNFATQRKSCSTELEELKRRLQKGEESFQHLKRQSEEFAIDVEDLADKIKDWWVKKKSFILMTPCNDDEICPKSHVLKYFFVKMLFFRSWMLFLLLTVKRNRRQTKRTSLESTESKKEPERML